MAWRLFQTDIHAEATIKPALVLVDDRFAADAPIAALHRLCWIGVWNRLPCSSGFWSPEETDALDSVDQDLIVLADQLGHGWAAYALRICTPGMREFYLYAGTEAHFEVLANAFREIHPEYRVEYDEQVDPGWVHYRKYLSAAP